ncbi:MFS transporter, partial [Pseudomonas sp. CGJS7]|uniref:MFS transporter n=1 Tax=Pseudomonas sp. CGJS7 TaxID=3109348 RepID=UPI0030082367
KRLLLGLMLAVFLGALEQTVVAAALPAIVRDLHRFDLMGWTVSAYLLATAVATPVIGKLSDLHGRRRLLHACMAIFALGSLLCAAAPGMAALIAARAVQGIGGAGLIVVAQAAVAELAGPQQRSRYAGYFAMVWAVAGLIGPLLGGALSDWLGWRSIFWINLPLTALTLAIAAPGLRRLGAGGGAGRIDLAATALFAVATCAFLLALSWGGAIHPWTSPPVLIAFAVSLASLTAFALRQRRSAEPLIAPQWLRHPVIAPALAVSLLLYGFYIAVAVLMPAYYQLGFGLPAAHAGWLLIPALVACACSALLGGRHAARTGDYRGPVLCGLALASLALLLLGLFAARIDAGIACLLLAALGFGVGPCTAIVNVVAQNAAPTSQLGAMTGAMALTRTLGAATVVAAGSALIVAHIQHGGAIGALDLSELASRELSAPMRRTVREAFGGLFLAASAGMFAALLAFVSIRSARLRPDLDGVRAAPAET